MRYIDRLIKFSSVALLIASAVAMFVWSNRGQNKLPVQRQLVHLPQRTMFKTIQQSDNAIGLIGFELHEDAPYSDGERSCSTFNAVIREMDPNSDEYKSLCRDIVADIISSCGDREVYINIYDSSEAYQLVQSAEQGVRMLTLEEERYANEHRVATYGYSNEYYNSQDFYLTFYPDASSRQHDNEVFTFQRTI